MSNNSSVVPDAWDDNWETAVDVCVHLPRPTACLTHVRLQHDVQTPEFESDTKVPARVTKAQRRAQHAEFNRQLWAEAYVHCHSSETSLS